MLGTLHNQMGKSELSPVTMTMREDVLGTPHTQMGETIMGYHNYVFLRFTPHLPLVLLFLQNPIGCVLSGWRKPALLCIGSTARDRIHFHKLPP